MIIIKNKQQLKKIRLQSYKKTIGLCHGAFDVLHSGHIEHFQECRNKCDILVVSLTGSDFIQKGKKKTFNTNNQRLSVLSSLRQLDYVYLDNNYNASEVIKFLRPDFYFKGKDYFKKDSVGNLEFEKKMLKKYKGKIHFTKSALRSSTQIIFYNFIDINKEGLNYIKKINNKFSPDYIEGIIERINKLKIAILGDEVIDKFNFININSIATKFPVLSGTIIKNEFYPGGVIPVFLMSKFFSNNSYLFTIKDKRFNFPELNDQKSNFFFANDLIIKERFLSYNRYERFLHISNKNLVNYDEKKIILLLNKIKKIKPDILLISDYGTGFYTKKIINIINNFKMYKSINLQINTNNNLSCRNFFKFNNYNFITSDVREWCKNFNLINDSTEIILKLLVKRKKEIAADNFCVTDGINGSYYVKKEKIYYAPTIIKNAVDATGCGDAYYTISSLLNYLKIEPDLIIYLSTIYAGLHSLHIGNSKIISKVDFIDSIRYFSKI